jgi:hypothetical protein
VVLALVGVVVVMVVVVVDFVVPLPLELQAPVSAVKAMAAAIPATTGKRCGMRFSVIDFVPLCVWLLAKMSWTRNTPSQPMPIKVTTSGRGKHSD